MTVTTEDDHLRKKLRKTFNGRPISIVGNATSLLNGSYGALIDESCVLRMNAGIPTRPAAQGRRIDIHCFSTKPNLLKNLSLLEIGLDRSQTYLQNALSIWMSPKDREHCDDQLQLFYPLEAWNSLSKRLGARPSVGAMTIDLIASNAETKASLFGFDFKASPTFYRKSDNRGPHDWSAEHAFALSTAERLGWEIFS